MNNKIKKNLDKKNPPIKLNLFFVSPKVSAQSKKKN